MPLRLPTACKAHGSLDQHGNIWISEEFVRDTWIQFATTRQKQHKRNGSNVPGPLEARRRASVRRMNSLAVGPDRTPGWLGGWVDPKPQQWVWEPPRKSARPAKQSTSPLPAWLTDYESKVDEEACPAESRNSRPLNLRQQVGAQWTYGELVRASERVITRDIDDTVLQLLRYCASDDLPLSRFHRILDSTAERFERGTMSISMANHIVRQLLKTIRVLGKREATIRSSSYEKIIRFLNNSEQRYVASLSTKTWNDLFLRLAKLPPTIRTSTIICELFRLIAPFESLFQNTRNKTHVTMFSLRMLLHEESKPKFEQLLRDLAPDFAERWITMLVESLTSKDREKNLTQTRAIESTNHLLIILAACKWQGRVSSGAQWNDIYTAVAKRYMPEQLSGFFATLQREDVLQNIVRYWLSEPKQWRVSQASRKSNDGIYNHVGASEKQDLLSPIVRRFKEELEMSKSQASPATSLISMLKALRHNKQPTKSLVKCYLPLSLAIDTSEEFVEVVLALRRSGAFRSLPQHSLKRFIAENVETAPVSALRIASTQNRFSLTKHPILAVVLIKWTNVPHSWIRRLLCMPDWAGRESRNAKNLHETLSDSRVDLIHQMATAFSHASRFSPIVAFANIRFLYEHLKVYDAPIRAEMTQAMTHALIVRSLRSGDRVSTILVRVVIEIVREVEGENVALELDRLIKEHRVESRLQSYKRGNLLIRDQERFSLSGGTGANFIKETVQPENPVRILRPMNMRRRQPRNVYLQRITNATKSRMPNMNARQISNLRIRRITTLHVPGIKRSFHSENIIFSPENTGDELRCNFDQGGNTLLPQKETEDPERRSQYQDDIASNAAVKAPIRIINSRKRFKRSNEARAHSRKSTASQTHNDVTANSTATVEKIKKENRESEPLSSQPLSLSQRSLTRQPQLNRVFPTSPVRKIRIETKTRSFLANDTAVRKVLAASRNDSPARSQPSSTSRQASTPKSQPKRVASTLRLRKVRVEGTPEKAASKDTASGKVSTESDNDPPAHSQPSAPVNRLLIRRPVSRPVFRKVNVFERPNLKTRNPSTASSS